MCVVCGRSLAHSLSLLFSLLSSSISLSFSLLSFLFSLLFLFLFLLLLLSLGALALAQCSFSFSSFFFLPVVRSLFSSLPFTPTNTAQSTDQQTRRPTLRRLNADVAHGTFIATANELHGMFPPLLLPPLLSSLHPEKREGTFYYRNISGEEFIFHYSLKLIPKNRRRVKLQALISFSINVSKQ